ncbi:MAG: thioredoxin family protein [Anaerolineae bacterium]
MLSKKDQEFLRHHLEHSLDNLVTLKLFTQKVDCQYCKETETLMTEVSELSDKITLEVYDLVSDKQVAETYGISRAPATAIVGTRDYGIRFYGIPSGYEFNSLIEDIGAVSNDHHGLAEETVEKLTALEKPVHIQVFVTPTCPYCPAAVQVAHALAMASDFITADMIEAVEFPQLANKYGVLGVPKTVINEDTEFEGSAPEELVVAKIMEAAGLMSAAEVAALFADFEAEVSSS